MGSFFGSSQPCIIIPVKSFFLSSIRSIPYHDKIINHFSVLV
jgi:hypothetical protein